MRTVLMKSLSTMMPTATSLHYVLRNIVGQLASKYSTESAVAINGNMNRYTYTH